MCFASLCSTCVRAVSDEKVEDGSSDEEVEDIRTPPSTLANHVTVLKQHFFDQIDAAF